jgi:hypothetical protein
VSYPIKMLDDYINKYYQLTFPAELKLERKHTYYEFLTSANVAWYDLPNDTYTNWEPPAKIDELSLLWYQDPGPFFENNPNQIARSTPWTGDGVTSAFNTVITQFPIMPDSLVITDNIETFQDTSQTWTTSNVVLVGDMGGSATINYSTGVISVTFNARHQQMVRLFICRSSSLTLDVLPLYSCTTINSSFSLYPTPPIDSGSVLMPLFQLWLTPLTGPN